MKWVATEEVATCEVTDFEQATDLDVLRLMDGYKVDTSNPEPIRMHDTEHGKRIIYDGVIYEGGFGFNLWVASKYIKL